jgi:hypothetical protein
VITLFTTPKPFTGHVGLIQRNALRSWRLLGSGVRVLLLGDEPGAAETAADLGLLHEPRVERNESGIPLLASLVALAERRAAGDLLCYANADIILTGDLLHAVDQVRCLGDAFLMAGRRTNLDVVEELPFAPGWPAELAELALREGLPGPPTAIDYFVFTHGLFGDVPPLVIGRSGVDNWMIMRARTGGHPFVDASGVVTAIHQNHDFSHDCSVPGWQRFDPNDLDADEVRNLELYFAGSKVVFGLAHATHVLGPGGVAPARGLRRVVARWVSGTDPLQQRHAALDFVTRPLQVYGKWRFARDRDLRSRTAGRAGS